VSLGVESRADCVLAQALQLRCPFPTWEEGRFSMPASSALRGKAGPTPRGAEGYINRSANGSRAALACIRRLSSATRQELPRMHRAQPGASTSDPGTAAHGVRRCAYPSVFRSGPGSPLLAMEARRRCWSTTPRRFDSATTSD